MIQIGYHGKVLYQESSEVLEQATQRGCGCPVPGGVQGQVAWGPGQPGLLGSNSFHGKEFEMDEI